MGFYIVEALSAIPLYMLLSLFAYRMLRVERRVLLALMINLGGIVLEVGFDMFGEQLGKIGAMLRPPAPVILTFAALCVCSRESIGKKLLCTASLLLPVFVCDMALAAIYTLVTGNAAVASSRLENIHYFLFVRLITMLPLTMLLALVTRQWERYVKRSSDRSLKEITLFPLNQWLLLVYLYVLLERFQAKPEYFLISSALAIVCMVTDVILYIYIRRVNRMEHLQRQNAFLNEYIGYQKTQYSRILSDIEHTNAMRHDMKNQLATVYTLMESGDIALARKQLSGLDNNLMRKSGQFCENRVADSVITSKSALCEQYKIAFHCSASIPETLSIEPTVLCSILSNLLDNAIAACRALPNGRERMLELSAGVRAGFLIVKEKNPAPDSKPNATEKDALPKHGLGLLILRRLADEYDGKLETKQENGCFEAVVWLALKDGEEGV